MNTDTLAPYGEVWLVDFEFDAPPGDRPLQGRMTPWLAYPRPMAGPWPGLTESALQAERNHS